MLPVATPRALGTAQRGQGLLLCASTLFSPSHLPSGSWPVPLQLGGPEPRPALKRVTMAEHAARGLAPALEGQE